MAAIAAKATPKDGPMQVEIHSHPQEINPWLRWLLGVVTVAGFLLSSYLALGTLEKTTILGCGQEGSACGQLFGQAWAWWGNVPVILLAVGLYLVVGVGLWLTGAARSPSLQTWGWGLLAALGVMAGGAAVWFVALQVLVIQKICPYCMATHAASLTLCHLIFFTMPWRAWPPTASSTAQTKKIPLAVILGITVGFGGIGVLAGRQIIQPRDMFVLSGVGMEKIAGMDDKLLVGKTIVAPSQLPQMGYHQPEAPNLPGDLPSDPLLSDTLPGLKPRDSFPGQLPGKVGPAPHGNAGPVSSSTDLPGALPGAGPGEPPRLPAGIFTDFTCEYCRQVHFYLKAWRQAEGRQTIVLEFVVPRSEKCNPNIRPGHTMTSAQEACDLARLALAVWRAKPQAYEVYADWLYENQDGMTAPKAKAQAAALVGDQALAQALQDPWIDQRIQENIQMLGEISARRILPVVILPGGIIEGLVQNQTKFNQILNKQLLAPPEAPPPETPVP
ncbi:MAG: hypothetical protein IT443_09425 [Phycisphaeraceae bacterium]|nr:hypothetical protein [Phycisphaeraceae bacterium]